jgi:hypothetical protein
VWVVGTLVYTYTITRPSRQRLAPANDNDKDEQPMFERRRLDSAAPKDKAASTGKAMSMGQTASKRKTVFSALSSGTQVAESGLAV